MALDTWTINKKVEDMRKEIISEIDELKKNFVVLYDHLKTLENRMPVEKAIKKESGKKKKVTSAQA
tara:strand:+ start:206 stop:403 length:198 start_codon:yes stop_codon:yes gene_type:complete